MFLSNLDRRVLATLKDAAVGRQKRDLRIAVLGNCQSFDVAYAMQLLNVRATVHHYPIQTKAKITGNMLVRALRTYDRVFLQDFGEGLVRGGSSDLLCGELANAIRYPSLLFGAYHPDAIFIHDRSRGDAFVSGPIGQHHSALALFAYRAGFTPESALLLYQREVYQLLGYFDVWEPASTQLLELTRSYGVKLDSDFIGWTRFARCFMYSINHPKAYVLFDLARRLLDHAGISWKPLDFDHYALNDLARDTIFPVYPEIAERFGIAGSYIFKAPKPARGGLNIGTFFDLEAFVRESYCVYARHDGEALTNERVQGWLQDAEVRAFLNELGLQTRRLATGRQGASSPELVPGRSRGIGDRAAYRREDAASGQSANQLEMAASDNPTVVAM
jgi:hypothetical protein